MTLVIVRNLKHYTILLKCFKHSVYLILEFIYPMSVNEMFKRYLPLNFYNLLYYMLNYFFIILVLWIYSMQLQFCKTLIFIDVFYSDLFLIRFLFNFTYWNNNENFRLIFKVYLEQNNTLQFRCLTIKAIVWSLF